jgi:ketosteroid isomerase-like protein
MHDLPSPIGPYYDAKNRQDIAAMIELFTPDAVVLDEGTERHGRDEIFAWMERTTKALAVQSEITAAREESGRMIVTAIVSGNFAASPVTLDYAFTLAGGLIARLEIA